MGYTNIRERPRVLGGNEIAEVARVPCARDHRSVEMPRILEARRRPRAGTAVRNVVVERSMADRLDVIQEVAESAPTRSDVHDGQTNEIVLLASRNSCALRSLACPAHEVVGAWHDGHDLHHPVLTDACLLTNPNRVTTRTGTHDRRCECASATDRECAPHGDRGTATTMHQAMLSPLTAKVKTYIFRGVPAVSTRDARSRRGPRRSCRGGGSSASEIPASCVMRPTTNRSLGELP